MLSNQVIKKSIEDLHAIMKAEMAVYDIDSAVVAATFEEPETMQEAVEQFSDSPADSQEIRGHHFFKVMDEGIPEYIVVIKGSGENAYGIGRIAVCQLEALITAYKDRLDRNTFIQNLLLDNLLVVDMYNRAKKLQIETEASRLVYIIETDIEKDDTASEILKELFAGDSRSFLTAVDERSLILVKEMEAGETIEDAGKTAHMICDMLAAEAMSSARVAFGTIVHDIQQVSRSYKEAMMALAVGKIFYTEKRVHAYHSLGIGRLIYQLPVNLCEMFINETFPLQKPDEIDEETLTTINKFFENSLNVSETTRQLFVHRNTLVYRLEKLQKTTGLDIRVFDDALTFKIALMVKNYMRHIRNTES